MLQYWTFKCFFVFRTWRNVTTITVYCSRKWYNVCDNLEFNYISLPSIVCIVKSDQLMKYLELSLITFHYNQPFLKYGNKESGINKTLKELLEVVDWLHRIYRTPITPEKNFCQFFCFFVNDFKSEETRTFVFFSKFKTRRKCWFFFFFW